MNNKKANAITIAMNVLVIFTVYNSNCNSNAVNFNSSYTFNSNVKSEFIEEYKIKIEELRYKEEQERIARELEIKLEEERVKNVNYNPNNLLITTGLKSNELQEILPDSMKHLASAIVGAEEEYQISALFIASVAALESGWATSSRAKNSNNLTGMAVYGDESPGIYYNSQEACIYDTARQLKKNYLTEGGMFHNGYSSYSVNIKYCESKDWYIKVDKIAYQLLDKYDKIFRRKHDN